MILLLSGFDDSVPPTGDKTFKIETRPDIVESIEAISDEKLPFWGFDIELKQNSADYLEIMIPKSFPTPASFTNKWYVEPPFVLVNGTEVGYDIVDDPCYDIYKIPISNQTKIEFVYPVILGGTWQLYSPVQFDESHPCYHEVFYEKPVDSPLKQLHSGISPDKVVCEADLELVHKHNGLAACVTAETREKLIQRSWAVDFPMEYIIDYDYWGKTYLVHHTMCAHIGVEEISEEEAIHRFFWTMTDDDLEKIPIIKSMLEYNSHGLYSGDEYPITSTVVPDGVQNQYIQILEELTHGEIGSWRAFFYDGKYYATVFSIC